MKMYRKTITMLGVLTIEGLILFFLSSVWTGVQGTGKENTVEPPASTAADNSTAISKTSDGTAVSQYDKKEVRRIYKADKKNLVLVNEEKELKEKDYPTLISISNGRLQASEELYDSLVRMLADARKEGYQYFIASAYRSRKKQQKLVENGTQKRMLQGLSYEEALAETHREIMPAGHSEHETGLALDILCAGNMQMDSSQKTEPANKWLRKNCHKYGFILRYPKEKEKITGITYEPWHFRYVGERAATYMRDENITLEEFWQRLD